MPDSPHPIILYDGVCGLCNRTVQFVLKRDSRDLFRFAALQSEFARGLFQKHGRNSEKLESVYLVLDLGQPTERMLVKSAAAISILRELGTFWRAVASLLSITPRPLRDWAYELVAHYRYRIFGKYDACPLPRPEDRGKFLDVNDGRAGPRPPVDRLRSSPAKPAANPSEDPTADVGTKPV